MHARSSLSEDQREAAIAWFEKGIAESAAARFLGVSRGPGEAALHLAAEVGLSSPVLPKTWARAYRREGADALRPKPKGRPKAPDARPSAEMPELERLRRENERLRADGRKVRRQNTDVPQRQLLDNAVMENFFGHFKEELFHRVRFISTDALETALDEYIRWYNTERISTKLEGLSPVQYRAQALAV